MAWAEEGVQGGTIANGDEVSAGLVVFWLTAMLLAFYLSDIFEDRR
jgi:hypothetical protein